MVKKDYFYWIYAMICSKWTPNHKSYLKLFEHLSEVEFTCKLRMDEDRAEDGYNLRYLYAASVGLSQKKLDILLKAGPPSVLEMMTALAVRCEEHIMSNPEEGDRTAEWFWRMLKNLGLYNMSDDRFDESKVIRVIDIFLNREYEPDGHGGLFVVEHSKYDLRGIEISYQMFWSLNEYISESNKDEYE